MRKRGALRRTLAVVLTALMIVAIIPADYALAEAVESEVCTEIDEGVEDVVEGAETAVEDAEDTEDIEASVEETVADESGDETTEDEEVTSSDICEESETQSVTEEDETSITTETEAESPLAEVTSDFSTEEKNDGTLKITGYNGTDTKITIPSEIDGKTVNEINSRAFGGKSSLVSITIPGSVTSIGDCAFIDCSSLEELVLNDGLEYLGAQLFIRCNKLTEVTLPKTVNNCFGCYGGDYNRNKWKTFAASSVKKVIFAEGAEVVPSCLFQRCDSIEEVVIPNTVKKIGQYAFSESTIKSVNIPDSVETIEKYAFYDCKSLEKVTIGKGITKLNEEFSFACCSSLKEVTIGENVTEITVATFKDCSGLEKIVIPYGVTSIVRNSFSGCSSLRDIWIPRSVTTISAAFGTVSNLTVHGGYGSYAQTWAETNGAKFEATDVPATSLVLDDTSLTVATGATSKSIGYTVTPRDYSDAVIFESLDESIATVSTDGKVKGVKTGKTKIRVSVGDSLKKECAVTVVQGVESIQINVASGKSFEAGDTFQFTATVEPANAYDKKVNWYITGPCSPFASISESGLFTAIKKSSYVEVQAYSNDGTGLIARCVVNVCNSIYDCDSVEQLESPHPYDNNCSDIWTYTEKDAKNLVVAFNEATKFAEDDYIHIYTKKGTEIGKYTGVELAGKSIQVPGNAVKIKLDTDSDGNEWGFKVDSVTPYEESVDNVKIKLYDGDVLLDTIVANRGEALAGLYNPKPKEGKVFAGWYTGKDGSGSRVTASTVLYDLSVLYAYYIDEQSDTFYVTEVPRYDYAGTAIKPEINVYDGETELILGKDYSVTYKNNVNAYTFDEDDGRFDKRKAPAIVVTGKGVYQGVVTKYFTIEPKAIDDDDIAIDKTTLTKTVTGRSQYIIPSIKWGTKALVNKKDFTLDYSGECKEAGVYTITIKGTNNYTGTLTTEMKLLDKNVKLVSKLRVVTEYTKTAYTGAVLCPNVTVYDGRNQLTAGEDYSVTYKNNVVPGTGEIYITGISDSYAGVKKVTFTITGNPISAAKVEGLKAMTYTGSPITIDDLKLTYKGVEGELVKGSDYELIYTNNVKAGTAAITIYGKGKYTGKVKKTFRIQGAGMADTTIAPVANVEFVKGGCTPSITVSYEGVKLREGVDYKLAYQNNKMIAAKDAVNDKGKSISPTIIVTGMGNYTGKTSVTFGIVAKDLANVNNISLADVVYKDKANNWVNKLVVTDSDGKVLVNNTDYMAVFYTTDVNTPLTRNDKVAADDVINVLIKAAPAKKGVPCNYSGEKTVSYKMTSAINDISKATIKVSPKAYTGKPVTISSMNDFDVKTVPQIKVNGTITNLILGEDFEVVEYINNTKKGTATVVFRGINNYSGIKKVTFSIGTRSILDLWKKLVG